MVVPRLAPAPLGPRYREAVLWQHDAELVHPMASALPRRVDVAIVGGGYAGVTAAWELARRGRDVVLLEARELGFGGSTRNGGMVIPELKHDLQWLTRRHGPLGRELVDAVLEAFDLVERVVTDTPIACDYGRVGGLLLAHRRSAVPTLRAAAREWTDELGESAWFVPREELGAEIGTTEYRGGLVVERTGGIHPARYHAGLVHQAVSAGAALCEHAAVTSIRRSASGFRVDTSRGLVEAADVLVATNAYADALLPELQRRLLPVGSFIIATEVLEPSIAKEISPRGRMFFDTKHFLFYWRLSPDGRIVFGGRTSLSPTTVPRARDVLYREMVRIHPQLRDVRLDYAWGGDVAITYDRLPHAGRIDGVAFVTGCNGTGVALATWLGHRAAAWLTGEADAPPFARLPFPKIPMYRGRRAYLPIVGQWFRARDRWF